MIEYESQPGQHIERACIEAVALANEKQEAVHFTFNDTAVTVQPGEAADAVVKRWSADMDAAREAWVNSPEYKARQEKEAEAYRQKCAASTTESATGETAMREAKVPWPYTKEQLAEYIESLVGRDHDYGTCVYAMSMAAEAAFNYVSHKLGVTGFQASCADLDFIRRTRSMKGPFMLIKGEDALYPQYNLREKLDKAMTEWKPWLKEEAAKMLAEKGQVHPEVVAHWQQLTQ